MSDSADSKLVGGVAADDGGQQEHAQPPQPEEISDEEEDLSEETESLSDTGGTDEPDFGKEKVKSLGALTTELITGEAVYLESLQCIVDGYIPAWDQPYLAAFLVGKKEIIFSNLANIFEFQRQFYMELLTYSGVQEICQCFKSHEEGFSLYLVYLKSLPQGKKVLSEYGGNFFEMVCTEKRYSRSFISNYLHTNERLNEYMANFKEMMNAAQKEELHSVNIIRDTLKIFQRIDRIAAFTCITDNPETLDENECLLMDDFIVYTVKKKKKKAEEMRVFLHDSYVIFTKATDSAEERGLSKHRKFEYLCSIKVNCLKLSETVEKGKHPEKFGLAEDKAGPDRQYILQPVGKCVEVKQEWCAEVNRLLLQQMEKLKQAQAHISGGKVTDELPPPMTHVVELPAKYQKYIKRESDGGRGSAIIRESKHESKHSSSQSGQAKGSDGQTKGSDGQTKGSDGQIKGSDGQTKGSDGQAKGSDGQTKGSDGQAKSPGNEQSIRRINIEAPQPIQSRSTSDRTIMYKTTEPYDGSGKEGHLTLGKGCQVEVLDKTGTDWVVCTVAETCDEVEKEGIVPMSILTPVTRRQASKATSKLISPPSSVPNRFSHLSSRSSTLSEQSSTAIPIVPLPAGKDYTVGKISHPILSSTTSPPAQQQQKVYFAIKDYHPDKEGYVHLMAGESVEILDKSCGELWTIATVGNDTRPSEEGLVPSSVLSAEYIPVRYNSIQDRCSSSSSENEQGVDRQVSKQEDVPPPLPPNHPNHDDDTAQPSSGGHNMSEKETGTGDPSLQTESAPQTEDSPQTENPQTEAKSEERQDEGEHKGDDEKQPLPSNHDNSNQDNSSEVVKSSDASGGVMDSHHGDTSSSANAEGDVSEVKKQQVESEEQSLSSTKMDSFEEIEVYVAIGDYTAQEDCNISLCSGQHVQVLDYSREDWWLVLPMAMIGDESSSESPKEGWVPANHLEKLT